MAPKFSTIFGYLIALIPAYILVFAPLSRLILGPQGSENDILDTSQLDPNLLSLIDPDEVLDCSSHSYNVHIFSRAPLVIYIESFLSDDEASHMVRESENNYETSQIWNGEISQINSSIRASENALLERDDVIKCVEDRARSFQGWRPNLFIERMRSQRYGISGHYIHHYDWTGGLRRGGDRISTFMVYLEANCTGGGTNFPRLKMPPGKKWCEFIECGDGLEHEGVTFKPTKGNAVFWENLRADGSGYPETWHAGLPVLSGTKVGLNIWSWYQPGRNQ